MVKIKCVVCGNDFEVMPYREKTAKYCSRKCKSTDIYRKMKEKGYGLAVVDGSHSIGNTYRKGIKPKNAFPKGNIPWNKGMAGLHLSPDTEFATGSLPANKMPIGTVTWRMNKNGTIRNFIKVSEPNGWKAFALYMWEEEYGEISDGYVIHHINKNALDDRLENFEKLTKAEHLERHRDDYKRVVSSRFINKAAALF